MYPFAKIPRVAFERPAGFLAFLVRSPKSLASPSEAIVM